jgi:hypothetical protein
VRKLPSENSKRGGSRPVVRKDEQYAEYSDSGSVAECLEE